MSIVKFKETINGEYQNVWTIRGKRGPQGERGNPGKTPEKGVDYWTDEDKKTLIKKITYRYTPVKYLWSDGSCWIDTGVKPKIGEKHEVKFTLEHKEPGRTIRYYFYGTNNFYTSYYSSWDHKGFTVTGQRDETDNAYVYTAIGSPTIDEDKTCYAFVINSSTATMKGRIYGIKIYNENNEIIYDFIPALDENSIPCFVEKIHYTFHYNIGDGNFEIGYFEEVNE